MKRYPTLIATAALSLGSIFLVSTPAAVADPAAAAPSPAASAPAEDPAITKPAASLLTQAQSGAIDHSLFNAKMNAALTPAIVATLAQKLGPLGKPKSIVFITQVNQDGYRTYAYRLVWDAVSVDQLIALDADGKVGGWFFRPSAQAQAPAASASPAASPHP